MVVRHATVFFGADNPPGSAPGDIARAQLEKRHGVKTGAPPPIERPGDAARAALKKRYGEGRFPTVANPDHNKPKALPRARVIPRSRTKSQ